MESKARTNNGDVLSFAVEMITPYKAQEYLKTSIGNRPISKKTVKTYAKLMKDGKWMLNGQSIIFDGEGHLMDGHHRLSAIIVSGATIEVCVIRGIQRDSYPTCDDGYKRSFAQVLASEDKKHYTIIAGTVAASETLRKTGRIWENNSHDLESCTRRTNIENYDLYQQDTEGYETAADKASAWYVKARIISQSWLGGIYYHLTKICGYDESAVTLYFDNLCSMDSCEYSAIEALRKRLLTERTRGLQIDKKMLFALIVKSWNAFIENKTITKLIYKADREEYPKFNHNKK